MPVTSNLNPETVLLIASVCTIISALCIILSLMFVRKGVNALKSANNDVIDSIKLISAASKNLENSFTSLVTSMSLLNELKKKQQNQTLPNVPVPPEPALKDKE